MLSGKGIAGKGEKMLDFSACIVGVFRSYPFVSVSMSFPRWSFPKFDLLTTMFSLTVDCCGYSTYQHQFQQSDYGVGQVHLCPRKGRRGCSGCHHRYGQCPDTDPKTYLG